MPLFSTLAALSQTAASNPPDGTVDAPSTIDDQLRLLGSFIAQLRDGAGFTVNALLPPGTGADYFGGVVPSGWLLCDGSAVSRTTYAALFANIGTTWGAGDGSTTFTLPDMRRRVAIGSGGTSVSAPANTLGATGGEETHALTTAELAAHLHGVSITSGGESANHSHGVTDGGHGHRALVGDNSGGVKAYTDPAAVNLATGGSSGNAYGTNPAGSASVFIEASTSGISLGTESASHTHLVSGNTASAGSGTAHNNMQPSAVVNKIIKT